MATQIRSLARLQIRGVRGHAQPGELFHGGTMGDDKLVITFKRAGYRKVGRNRVMCDRSLRMVTCVRQATRDGADFFWQPVEQMVIAL